VPMCQSPKIAPKIADVSLRTRKIPANDNRAPAKAGIKAGPESFFKATRQTFLIFCCAIAFLLL